MNKKVDFPSNSYPVTSTVLDEVNGFDQHELSWLSGYCAGLAKGRESAVNSISDSPVSLRPSVVNVASAVNIQVLYASQTGNSQKVAEILFDSIKATNSNVEIANIADIKPKDISKKQVLLFAISTHGEGEPPDDAIDFFDFINSKRAPKLSEQKFAVLGLGDSSYEFFCQTGKDLEKRLLELGAQSIVERVDCDLDYDHQVESWIAAISEQLGGLEVDQSVEINSQENTTSSSKYSKNSPFAATILENQRITGSDSDKAVHHLELSLEGSGITYQAGDGVGIWAKNNPSVVKELLKLTGLDGEAKVAVKDVQYKLVDALTERLELSLINKNFVESYAAKVAENDDKKSKGLTERINQDYSGYLSNHQIADVIALAPIRLGAQELVDLLKPIKPRVYSISSSPSATPDEVHITVKLQQTTNEKKERLGTASRFLVEELVEDEQVMIFIEENSRFRLPQAETDILMVGPGTGVAPFRSFLLEREEQQATGKNWLFFGNAFFNSEFLYQLELQKMLTSGLLTHLSVAFSRDQAEKIYVQHRLLQNSKEIWNWLNEKNASFYVCGDMNYMAKDVELSLLEIFQKEGELTEEQANNYLKAIKKDGRYQRDVY